MTLPNLAADQPALGAQAAHLGVGVDLPGDTATAADIACAVRTVLDDPGYTSRAEALASRINTYRDQPLTAVEAELTRAAGVPTG